MRPKLLEIEGLQSFTDMQRINFEALGETGLFGIFGPTGSGKSTILDAITFALYGKVKRADGGTQGIINSNCNTARVSFSFELNRGGKRRNYRVERTYQRKKNSQNACEPKIARLIEITGDGEIPLCDKAMEVSYFIKELLGLSNEDFTRAVVLPQGSFDDFLKLNNSERRGMLERIFYLEEYGKQLSDKLIRKMSRLKSRLDLLAGELAGFADASDAALEEARKEMESAVSERKKAEKEFKLYEARFNEAKEVWNLVCEIKDFTRKEEQHLSLKEVIDEKRNHLEKAIKAEGLLEIIQKNRDLRQKLKNTEQQLNVVMARLPELINDLNETRIKYDSIKSESASEQPKLVGIKIRLADALGMRGEIAAITSRILELQTNIAKLGKIIEEKNKILKSETNSLESVDKDIARLKNEAELLKADPEYRQSIQDGLKLENDTALLSGNVKDLEAKEASLAGSVNILYNRLESIKADISAALKSQEDLEAERKNHEVLKPGEKNAVQKAIERIYEVQGQYNILLLRKNELEQINIKTGKQKEILTKAEQKAATLEEAEKSLGNNLEQCRLELDKAKNELNKNFAYSISKNLKEGEACPVCGSTHHPVPAAGAEGAEMSVLEHEFEKAQVGLDSAEKDFRTAEKETLVAAEQVKTAKEQLVQMQAELETKKAEYDAEKNRLPEKLKELELEQIRTELDKTSKTYSAKMEAIEAWEKKQEEYKENQIKLNDLMAQHRLIENSVNTELKVSTENMAELEKLISAARKAEKELLLKYSDFLKKYGIESVDQEIKRISENDRNALKLQKEYDMAVEAAGKIRNQLDKLKEELQQSSGEKIKLEADKNSLFAQKLEREAKLRDLAGDLNIEDEIKRIDNKIEEYAKLENEYDQKLEQLEKQHGELQTGRSLLENQLGIYSGNLLDDEARLKSTLSDKGFRDEDEVNCSVLSEESWKVLKQEIDEYDRTLTNIQAQKGLLQKKLKSRDITEVEWNRINNGFTELTSYKEECVSRSEVAKSRYEILNKKHERWLELGSKFNELSHKQGLYEQIQKLLKAEHRKDNSFIDYIAEERLRYVAAKASVTLGVMTKYKYGLELDAEAGFIIRDNTNGGVHRMVTSLSGGETFLTSLSLALALSEQIQLKGQSPLEFFFLDEGFGTLDRGLLDTVIDSLERLSSRERVIGLISHVPELKSRIGRRLTVDPPAMPGDGSRVTIEKA